MLFHIGCIDMVSLHCESSDVSQDDVFLKMFYHIGCIGMVSHPYESSYVS